MRPQADSYPDEIEVAVHRLLDERLDAVHRDHFDCRYCGGRTILTPVMELLGELNPDIFPFYPSTTDQGCDGLTCYYRALWERAGRPKPRLHEAWPAALEASKPRR